MWLIQDISIFENRTISTLCFHSREEAKHSVSFVCHVPLPSLFLPRGTGSGWELLTVVLRQSLLLLPVHATFLLGHHFLREHQRLHLHKTIACKFGGVRFHVLAYCLRNISTSTCSTLAFYLSAVWWQLLNTLPFHHFHLFLWHDTCPFIKNKCPCTPLIPTLRRQRKADLCEFGTSLVFTVSSIPARAT